MGLNGKQLLENFKEDEAYGNTTYTPPANDDDSGTQTGLLDGLLGKVGAAADWVNNNIEYVEKSPVGQWVGNNVEWLESTPVGQALAPSNSVIKNLPALLGLAINASVTPKDDDTFGGSAYNALANGEANVIGTMADFLHQDDLAASMRALADKTQDDTPVAPGLDWNYITSPHGLTRSTFNAVGSMIPTLPSVFLAPESLVAAAGRISPWLANGARFGMTAIPEAMSEGGQTRREAIEDGLDHPDLRAIGTAAKNLPLLAVSNTLEGAVLGGGLGKALAGKAGESVLARMAKAPLRATPSALVEGLQNGLEEGLQQGIQDSSLDKEHGWLPWNWNDEQWQNAAEGFWGTLPLGAIGGARKAVFPGNVSSGGSTAADSLLDQAQDDIDSVTSQAAQQSVIQSAQQDMENNPYTAPTATQDTSYEAPSDTSDTSSGSSYDASALEGDPQYTVSGEVSSTDVTPLTDQKMRLLDSAYYNKYGQHLFVTSMKRNGDGSSWHDSGQAFDTADDNLENNKEARDWLISEGEKLGLTPLDEYEHPSANATGGHIHFSDHGEPIPDGIRVGESDSDMDDSDMDDSTGGVDLSNLPVGDIAMAIAQNTNLPVNFIWSQLSHESDGGKSKLAVEDHNYGGVKGTDGNYLHFDNDQQFIDYMSNYYPKYREDGIYDAKTADQFAEALQHGGYFTADLGEYEGGMHRYLEQAGLSQDAMSSGKARRAGRKGGDSTSSTPDLSGSFEISADDPAMDSMFASFAKDWQNMSTDANEINFFGDMFNSRNKFKATEENKQAILDNYGDAFRQYVQENQPQTVQATQTAQAPAQPKQAPQPQHIEVHTPNLDSEQAKEAQMHAALAPKIFKPIDLAPFKGNPAGALGYLDELRQVAENFNYNKDYIRSIDEQMHKIGKALGVPTDDSATIYDALNNDQRDSYNYEFMRHRRDTLQAIHDYPIHPQQKQQVGEYIHMLDEEIARLQGKAAQAPAVQQTGAQAAPQSTPQAPAQKAHIATATPKQENPLFSIPDSAIAAAKQADDGFSAPLNIFSADEQKALRNAGLVYDDADYNGAERVEVAPLYWEGDRRMNGGKAKVKAETKKAGKVDKYKKDAEKIYLRFKSGKFSADDSVNQLENLKKKATSDKALSDEEKAEVVAEADNQIHRIKPQKETKEHETQKYSSKTAETAQGGKAEGHPHQDAEPEKGRADAEESEVKAEEGKVSHAQKVREEGGRKAVEQLHELYPHAVEGVHKAVEDFRSGKVASVEKAHDNIDKAARKFLKTMGDVPLFAKSFEEAAKDGVTTFTNAFKEVSRDGSVYHKFQDEYSKAHREVNAIYEARKQSAELKSNKVINRTQDTAKVPGGLSKEAQGVYIAVRDKLRTSKSESARRAADVSAEILARHADTYAKAYSKATGKKYTAADYMRDKIGIDTDGNAVNDEKAKRFFQTAWHGSPHDFDRFDLGAIGTGEGAQVHGWGLYFAANREVSEGYIDRLSDVIGHEIAKDGSIVQKSDEEWKAIDDATIDENTPPIIIALKLLREARAKEKYNVGEAIQDLQWKYIRSIENDIRESSFLTKWYKKFKYRNTIKNLRMAKKILEEGKYNFKNIMSGHLFEVEIPEADTMLDEQLSYNEQPKLVQKAIDALFTERKKLAKEWKNLSAAAFKETYHPRNEMWMYFMERLHLKEVDRAFAVSTRESIGEYLRGLSGSHRYEESKIREIEGSEQAYNYAWREVKRSLARVENYIGKMVETTDLKVNYRDLTGREIYQDYMNALEMYHNITRGQASKETALALRDHGVNGITYIGGRDGRCYVTFDDKTVKIINKYNQMFNGAVQGYTSVLSNGKRIVTLYGDSADESTFLHEMGHVFLLDLQDLASIDQTSANDMAAVESWAMWKKGQAKDYKGTAWEQEFADREEAIAKAMADGDEATASQLKDEWMQERFARGFERYLESGEAPSSKLKSVFEKFKQFLTRIYNAFKGAGGKPSEDVKNVMARMIDSDVENTIKVPAMGEPIHGIKGTETTVVTDSGKEIRVRYLVVSASRVITSHNAETMTPNKAYPQELQPRDRQRVSMQEQVTTMANELRPADLGVGRNLNQGAPIIRKDGVVLNGNGRAMAIQKATAAGGDKATAYRKYIFEHSKEFGLSRVDLAQVRKYMLVREVVDDIDADTMQDIIGSTAGGSRMGASEQAKVDAKKIKPRDLERYVDNEQGDLTTAANRDFVASVLYRIVGKNERNAYTDEHGNVNADGIQRVKRALFSLAYDDDGLIDKMAESTDDNIRNVSRGLMSAAPAFARVNLAVKDGQAYEYDAAKTISDAVKHLDALRREGKPVKDYLNEQSMFSEYQDTDEVREVLRFLDENKRSGKRIGIFLNDMARSILEQGSPNQTSLMDGGRATLGEIIKAAERVARDGTTAANLFDNVQEEAPQKAPARAEKASNEEAESDNNGRVFLNDEDTFANLEYAFGLKPKAKQNEIADEMSNDNELLREATVSEIEKLKAEIEKDSKELHKELSKLSANPMVNPKVYVLGAKIGIAYIRLGYKTFKPWAEKVLSSVGDEIRPWLRSIWNGIANMPKDAPFDAKKYTGAVLYCGNRIEKGMLSYDMIADDFKERYGEQAYNNTKGYLQAAYVAADTRLHPEKYKDAQKGENNHADDSTSGLAERAGRGSDSDAMGTDDADGESGRGSGRGVQETEGAVRPEGGVRVRDRSTAAGGEAGDRGVQVEESGDRAGSAGSAHVSRSVSDSYEGSVGHDADRTAASIRLTENRRDNASPAGARARDVKPNKSGKRGNLGSIKNDLPMLQPEQQEDVEFIETRVNVNNKPGVMLTNGTGTGKTYSGLGFIKRMYDAGKKNILIVSPSESINDQWIEAANKHFNLSIEKLSSTKDSGKDGEICITTYANLQANRELVNRNWDAVVSDESHTLMQNEKGEETGYLSMLRALTMNPRGAYKRFKLQHRTKEIRSLENQIEEREKKAKAILRPYGDKKKISSADKAKVDALQKEIEGLNKEMEGIFMKMSPGTDKLMQDLKAAYPEEKRPKVLFLSATPFSHDKDIDYAEGYLFHYDEDTGRYGGYNVGTPSDQFMVKHFGYRMRTGKLTRPDAEVDSRAMEVQFHDNLVNSGAMHGRQIAVDKDYDRGFILVNGGIGHKIDEGFKFLSDNHAAYGELYRVLSKQFNKSQQKYLIESIKAREVIPLIREYVKKGKKVVLFHQSMVEHKNIHPFQLKPSADLAENSEVWAQWKAFKSAQPDLVDLSLGNIPAPMETLRKELSGHAVFINGNVPKKDRAKNIERFNDDDSGVNIIVCQQDAANAGISLHDTTGKHPRVLINIAMPERPSYAMQIEGRIYRVGNASNAVFRYLSTGTDIEKNMFASTIGGRAASVENLAVGNAARGLRESFRDLYQETMDGSWKRRLPGAEGEGTGGKELDYAATSALSDYDRAKSFYFAQQKRTARTKAQEGNDYFSTPEPIGYKMVEWLGLKPGEKALEPSAGHGAISRWFPENVERTIVEPSAQLAPIAQMNTPDAKVVHTRFEDFNIVNKFDGIAMNPPFGTGGKTAVEHLQKAFHHLRDGGRVIAILPEGPAADKRLDKLLDEIVDEAVRVADIHLPAVAFTRAGTKVMTHIVVLDRYTKKAERDAALANIGSYADIDLRHIDGTKELFDRLEGISLPDRTDVKKQAERVKDAESQFTTDTYEHTKTHEMMFKARPRMYLGDSYREVSKLAKEHGGYYSRYADNSFLFKNEEDRDAFVKQADELLGEKGERYSAEEQQEEQVRALDELKQEVRDALPSARDIRDDGNRLSFTMPNGAKVEVQLSPSIEVSDTEAGRARAAHGIKPSVRVKINGRERTIGTTALVELSQLGRKGTAYHEAFHAVYDMCLTDKEKAALHKAYDKEAEAQGRDTYEVMADKYRDWMIAKQKGQHTLYGKLWQKVKDAAARLARVVRGADNAGDVFRKVASGEAWERPYNEVESDTRYAAERKGAQSFIKAAASKLGKRMGVKSDKIITEEAKAKEGIGILDYLIASPSRVATRVKSFRQFYRIGVRAMDVLTERRSYYQRKLGKAMQLVKSKNDYEELTDILLSGDAEGKEWTKEELIQSGTKENVAEAYTRIRRLMRQAYKMVNEAHKHPKTYSKRLSNSKIEELRQNPFVKIMKIHDEEDDGRHLVTYREFANYEHTLEGVTKQALDGMRVDEDMQVIEATKQADGTYKVRVREGRGDVTNRKGYIPHFFHNYMVEEVRDEDGNYVTTITSGRTQREAVKKAEEWMKDNKLEDGQKIYIHPKIFDFTRYGMSEKGIVQLGDKDFHALMNLVAKDNDMSLEEAKDLLQNVHQKNRHRFFGNVLHRKGVSGFETDMNYVLNHYFNSASRYYAMETEFKPQAISLYERLFGDFAKDSKSSLAQYVKDYINDVNGTPSALERGVNDALMRSKVYRDFVVSHYGERAVLQLSSNIAGATTYMCLGYFNVSSALLNLTQVMNSAAYIGDVSALGKCLSKGMHRKYSLHDLKVLKETNVLNDIGLDSGSGYDVNRMSAKSLLGKINKAGMSIFKISEQTVRIGTVLAAYESGIKRGMSHEEAIDFAKEVNQKSNFDYSVADAPNIFRRGSFLSQLALQFKKYGIKELEVMADMCSPRTSRKQKLIFWGTYLLAAGLCGLPALDWLDEVLGWVFGKSPKLAAQEAIMEATGGTPVGKFIGRMAMYGLPSSLVGVDLSNRVGLSDVVPTELKNFLPPLATKIPQFMQDIFSEAKINAIRDFSPAIYNQIAAWGTGKSYDKRGRINAEYNTFYDKLLRSIGFKSTDERVDSDIRRITSERRSELNAEKQKAVDAYIAHPTPQNMQKLKDLGVKDSTVKKERERKKEDSYNRTKGGMTKKEAQENQQLLNFK